MGSKGAPTSSFSAWRRVLRKQLGRLTEAAESFAFLSTGSSVRLCSRVRSDEPCALFLSALILLQNRRALSRLNNQSPSDQ